MTRYGNKETIECNDDILSIEEEPSNSFDWHLMRIYKNDEDIASIAKKTEMDKMAFSDESEIEVPEDVKIARSNGTHVELRDGAWEFTLTDY